MTEFYTNVSQIGNHILVRGFKDGQRFTRRELYEPYLFISTNESSPYKTIHGQPVKMRGFDSISEARDFIKRYKDVDGIDVYGFDRWPYVYIYDYYREIEPDTSLINIVSIDIEVISEDGSFPKPEEALHEVVSITMRKRDLTIILGLKEYVTEDKNVYYIQCKDEFDLLSKFLRAWEQLDVDVLTGWNTEFFDIPYLVNRITMVLGDSEAKRLSPWRKLNPYSVKYGSRVSEGYNIVGIACLDYLAVYKKFRLQPRESYRLDYIAEVELGTGKLDYSEHGDLRTLYEKDHQKFIDYNRIDVDLILQLEEKLGYIAQAFMIAYDAGTNFNDALSTLSNWDAIIHRYLLSKNIVIPVSTGGKEYNQIEGGYVKPPITGMHNWVLTFDLNSLYPSLIQHFAISPENIITDKDLRSYQSDSAKYLSSRMGDDHRLIGVNVERLLKGQEEDRLFKALEDLNLTMTANGMLFRREQGFLPELMRLTYAKRKEFKEKMLKAKNEFEHAKGAERERLAVDVSRFNTIQHATKILANSLYGALASKYFRWFNANTAEAITVSGQLTIRWVEQDLNRYLNKILKTENEDYAIMGDTDSVAICLDRLVQSVFDDTSDTHKIIDFLDRVAKTKIEPVIAESFSNLSDLLNSHDRQLVMKREVVANKSINIGKKRYIMNVFDQEGVRFEKPTLKMMGIEAIRSSTPTICREFIRKTLELIMSTDEETVQKYIRQVRHEFNLANFKDIAFPRSISFIANKTGPNGETYQEPYADPNTIYRKGTPIQVKGALVYNHYLNKYNLTRKYEEIKDSEKIKFCYLKVPNPFQEKVIAFPNTPPAEFNIDRFIDYDTQFEKGYLIPMKSILDAIGWDTEKRSTLDGFFS